MHLTRDVAIKKAKEHFFFCFKSAYSDYPMSPFQPLILAKAGCYSYIPAHQNTLGKWNKIQWLTPGCTSASLTHIKVSPLNIKFEPRN